MHHLISPQHSNDKAAESHGPDRLSFISDITYSNGSSDNQDSISMVSLEASDNAAAEIHHSNDAASVASAAEDDHFLHFEPLDKAALAS